MARGSGTITRHVALAALLGTGALTAAPARAEPPARPFGLTVAGAVSLGTYEAGLLYYLVEALRLNPGSRELRLVTGTSAGSANGLLAILQHCGAPPGPPAASQLWGAWIGVGVQQLHRPEEPLRLGALSRKAIIEQAERIEAAWRAGLRERCDVVLGISATRAEPRLVRMNPESLRLPRIDEQFALRIQGRGPGRPPRLTNYVDPAWGGDQLLLPEDEAGEVPFAALRDLLLASVAFPGAFEPQPLAHCLTGPGQREARCPAASARTALFVDGGMLDNTPLHYATRLARAGLRAEPAGWADAPHLGSGQAPDAMVYAFVSPNVVEYPAEERPRPPASRPELLDHLARVGGAFFDAAGARILLGLVEEEPEVGGRVSVPVRSLPAAGAPVMAFFGFFERSFREFDFHLGMYEARRLLAEGGRSDRWGLRRLPEEEGPPEAWAPLRCLRAVVDGAGLPAEACAGEGLEDFRLLLQVSLERLFSACARPGEPGQPPGPALCAAARAGAEPPRVPGVRPLRGPWAQRPTETQLAHVMRLLVDHRLAFRDHGLKGWESKEAPAALRRDFVAIGKTASRRQPVADAVLLETLVGLAADSLAYVPPRHSAWLVLGRDAELGYSYGFFDALEDVRWFRLHAAAQLNLLGQAISSDEGPRSVTLLGGAELLPPRISSTRFQLGALLRAGVQLSSNDGYGARACPDPGADTLGSCTRPVLQGGLVVALFERVRLHLIGSWYPPYRASRSPLWALSPAGGLELSF